MKELPFRFQKYLRPLNTLTAKGCTKTGISGIRGTLFFCVNNFGKSLSYEDHRFWGGMCKILCIFQIAIKISEKLFWF